MAEDSSERRGSGRWFGVPPIAFLLCVVGGIAALVTWTQRLPEGVQPIAWDREACAHCRMHIGEPHFAAQLQLVDGRVLSFDDPGCLLRERAQHDPKDVHAIWVHHLREDRWLPLAEAGFIATTPTPMGWGYGAVDRSSPGAISADEAQKRISAAAPEASAAREAGASWR